LATAGDGTVRVWKIIGGKEVGRISQQNYVIAVAFSPNGKHLATASGTTARVWDVATGEEVFRVTQSEQVNDVAFSPDGEHLATASYNDTARVWLWQRQDLFEEACSRLSRNLTKDEWQRYLGDEPYHKTCPNLPM
jgi:WD40 repeat protein